MDIFLKSTHAHIPLRTAQILKLEKQLSYCPTLNRSLLEGSSTMRPEEGDNPEEGKESLQV